MNSPEGNEERGLHDCTHGEAYSLDIESETPLLWVIRDELGMTGTKFG
jgi:aerobic-type carbon monoxide dehydrogenase small subunit (CoxS/CutS family)